VRPIGGGALGLTAAGPARPARRGLVWLIGGRAVGLVGAAAAGLIGAGAAGLIGAGAVRRQRLDAAAGPVDADGRAALEAVAVHAQDVTEGQCLGETADDRVTLELALAQVDHRRKGPTSAQQAQIVAVVRDHGAPEGDGRAEDLLVRRRTQAELVHVHRVVAP
jgi:hypothetical protein